MSFLVKLSLFAAVSYWLIQQYQPYCRCEAKIPENYFIVETLEEELCTTADRSTVVSKRILESRVEAYDK